GGSDPARALLPFGASLLPPPPARCWWRSWRSARLPASRHPPRSYEGAMEEAERAAAGKLLHLVSPKTRKKGADNDQSDPPRRVYRTCRAVPVPRLRVGKR